MGQIYFAIFFSNIVALFALTAYLFVGKRAIRALRARLAPLFPPPSNPEGDGSS